MTKGTGNNVRKLREARLMSRAELTRKAGVSTLTVARIEGGKSCRMETRRKIIQGLGLELSDHEKVFPTTVDAARTEHQ